jgi:hemolysin activation/secretion protein
MFTITTGYFMKHKLLFVSLLLGVPSLALAADAVPASTEVPARIMPVGAPPQNSDPAAAEQEMLRFTISQYEVEGATLLSKVEIDAAVAPYVGTNKDFSDVQRALEAVEDAYAKRGYSAVRVLLPEQELEKGTVRFRVVETRFGKVTVKDNRFVSQANVLNALPSVHPGGVPGTRQISRELKLANENPARQLNVVLKGGEKEDEVDANLIVTDNKPSSWGVSVDNTGSQETGRGRVGLSYRHANVFDLDHVLSIQYVTSPQYSDRVKVLGGNYKIPFYRYGGSLEFFAGYSNVNALMGGLNNFQGGGKLLNVRYNHMLDRIGVFDSTISAGLDWRDFRSIELGGSPPTPLYGEIVVMPFNVTYSALGKFAQSEANFNASFVANLPGADKGKAADFAAYDQVNLTSPNPNYKLVRYGAAYSQSLGGGWQARAVLNGQWSGDVLVQGEQMRLGGADAVRGFSEGSEGGEKGARLNLEGYTPDFGNRDFRARALVFCDAGQVTITNAAKTTISSAGVGLRANYGEMLLRLDVASILKAGTDPEQQAGKLRAHFSFNANF